MILDWLKSQKLIRQISAGIAWLFIFAVGVFVWVVFDASIFDSTNWSAEWAALKDGRLNS